MRGVRSGHRWSNRFLPRVRSHPIALVRRVLAIALLLVAAVLAIIPAIGDEPGRDLLVAARDLPLGAKLRPADVRVVQAPDIWHPAGALRDPSEVTGRRIIGQARAGEPLTDARVAERYPSAPDTATVPVRLADSGVTELLRPGTHVDVVTAGTDAESGNVLASRVTVHRVIRSSEAGQSGPRPNDPGPLVLLSAPGEVASRLAAASLGQPVTVTLR